MSRIKIRLYSKIYIPLCIYFNKWILSCNSRTISIYIPLCIYFNLGDGLCCWQAFNLHSTMYLFQLCPLWQRSQLGFYLHSTMYLFQRKSTRFSGRYNKAFTFHYVSISTRHWLRWFHQSALIYIPLCIYFNGDYIDLVPCDYVYLHSTMYQFQQSRITQCLITLSYLHSTMYLFQPTIALQGSIVNAFTFHYVSISTRYLRSLLSCLFYLHSTMYLFQRSSASVWKS